MESFLFYQVYNHLKEFCFYNFFTFNCFLEKFIKWLIL